MGRSRPQISARGVLDALPTELTSFIGRDRELEELGALLRAGRLLTLTGAGGSGKTRLAMELVRRVDHAGPVGWASLAPLEDASHLARAVADAFAIREEAGSRGTKALIHLLQGSHGLLVLDNCEHLVEACAELADALLRGCPQLRILATSREPLGVGGERAWLIPALAIPPEGRVDPDSVADFGSVRLFVERARDVLPAFDLTSANAASVVEICRRLDGIPLAIELAAARARIMAPEQLLERLDDAFRVLTTGRRTAPPRHRTLRAAIDWSHGLLSDSERVLLRRLSVFRGGLTLDAVEAVAPDTERGLDRGDVLDTLSRLVDRSLVMVREQSGATRYDLLETVRQYAASRLVEGGEGEAVRGRHARWMLTLAREAEPWLTRRERPLWVRRLLPELDNLREALAWSRAGDPATHVDLATALWWFWFSTQHWSEARRWLDDALTLPIAMERDARRARLLFAAGALGVLQGRGVEWRPSLEEAIALARSAGDERLEAYATNYLGMSYAGAGRPEGEALCAKAAEWFRRDDDLYGLRLALLLLGSTATFQGRLDEGERLNAEGVAVARRFGVSRELGISLQNLAVVHLVRGSFDRAEPLVREALAAFGEDPSYFFMATGLGYLAEAVGALGRPLEAARLFGAAEAARESIGARPFPGDAARLDAAVPVFRDAAGADAFDRALTEGRALSPQAAIAEVLSSGTPAAAEVEATPALRAEASVDLRVNALGPLELIVAGRPVQPESWSYAKPKELLAWLLLNREGGSRDEIARQLWPDATPAQLKNSFHVTVHHLRKALGNPEWVTAEGGRYRLASGLVVELDVDAFELASRGALDGNATVDQLRGVLSSYRGDLLADEHVGSWLLEERDRVRAVQVAVAMELGHRLEEGEELAAAAAVYHSIVMREDLNEEVHRRLMACWARAGDRARALRWYDRLVGTLADVLDAEPEAETVRLVERIRKSEVPRQKGSRQP